MAGVTVRVMAGVTVRVMARLGLGLGSWHESRLGLQRRVDLGDGNNNGATYKICAVIMTGLMPPRNKRAGAYLLYVLYVALMTGLIPPRNKRV